MAAAVSALQVARTQPNARQDLPGGLWPSNLDSDESSKYQPNPEVESDETGTERTSSNVEELGRGLVTILSTRTEFTILLIGESGVGKTTFLTLFYNVFCGRGPKHYVPYHEQSNEAGGSQACSQTQAVATYEFTSNNGFKIRIIDTPGLADTRGLCQDQHHRRNIITAIEDGVVTIDAVLVLVNGTNPRLGVATDYALTALASIIPRHLLQNVGILFTNVSSPLSWNFEHQSLPEGFREVEQFLVDNPISLSKKFEQLRAGISNYRVVENLWQSVEEGHTKALDVLAEIIAWVDSRERQPTEDILVLYTLYCDIDHHLVDALALVDDLNSGRQILRIMQSDLERAQIDVDTYKNYESYTIKTVHVQEETSQHNVCCISPGCYSTCKTNCTLSFSLDPAKLLACDIFNNQSQCTKCGHGHMEHRHFNSKWVTEERVEEAVDNDARRKFLQAQELAEQAMIDHSETEFYIAEVESRVANMRRSIQELSLSYAELALGGTFAEQVAKSARLLETNLESLRNDPTLERAAVESAEKDLVTMRAKRDFLEQAL